MSDAQGGNLENLMRHVEIRKNLARQNPSGAFIPLDTTKFIFHLARHFYQTLFHLARQLTQTLFQLARHFNQTLFHLARHFNQTLFHLACHINQTLFHVAR